MPPPMPPPILNPALPVSGGKAAAEDGFRKELEAWRAKRRAGLEAEDGWLTLVGLDWLKEGENPFGSAASNAVRLPDAKSPAKAGTFLLDHGVVRLHAEPGSGLKLNGKPAEDQVLKSDADGKPDTLAIGSLTFYVIRRGERFGIRIKDSKSPVRAGFKGIRSYPPDRRYRVEAEFVPYAAPRTLQIPTVLNTTDAMQAPGYVKFRLRGREFTLEPVIEDPAEPSLFFIFRDRTSGKGTYPAGRFLYAAMPKDGRVVLDFNQAYNPPCAFTPFATCPLPPPQNRLDVAVEAGEKTYGHH